MKASWASCARLIGVDVLSAGTNEQSGEVEVRAGKYVADDVFVGVTQGADPTSTKVTVEVEVTPNISVESDVGQDASGRGRRVLENGTTKPAA